MAAASRLRSRPCIAHPTTHLGIRVRRRGAAQVFSDRDISSQREKVQRALDTADVFFGSLLFDFDEVRPRAVGFGRACTRWGVARLRCVDAAILARQGCNSGVVGPTRGNSAAGRCSSWPGA